MRWRDFDHLPPLESSFLNTKRHFHFTGIGGIGMSALAFFLLANNHDVSGSDVNDSDRVQQLRDAGAVIAIGHDAANLQLLRGAPDGLIYSSAVTIDNVERVAASQYGVTQWHRAQLLAAIANQARCSIAVSGTHGKSTTSAMIAHMLEQCGKNPTALLGAKFPPFGSNMRIGDPDLIVLEADESDGSFTLMHPAISVVTNVEAEHLENYDHSEDQLWQAFEQFIESSTDVAVLNADHPAMYEDLRSHTLKVLSYTLAGNDDIEVGVPGTHNRSNAAAVLAVAMHLGIAREDALKAIKTFHGVARRFEKVGEVSNITVYDDYAHHPTEVESTLEAAKTLDRPIIAIFQPHRYSRTQQLGRQFGACFEAADTVIITELYSAFEEPIPGVSGRIVFDAVRLALPRKKVLFAPTLDAAKEMALQIARSGDVIFTLGAGDITKLARQIIDDLPKRQLPASKVLLSATVIEPLSRHTTVRMGGAARWWIEPNSNEELAAALETTHRLGIPVRVIGAGSNVIVSDDNFDGAVIRLGIYFSGYCLTDNSLIVGGLAMLSILTHFALLQKLGGAEWMCHIPGTAGAAIRGNAGALGFDGKEFVSGDCASILQNLVVFDRTGKRHRLNTEDVEFGYRTSSLEDLIVTEATFGLYSIDVPGVVERRKAVAQMLKERRRTQPIDHACAGRIWKNPRVEGYADAGAIAEELGCKGMTVGDAEVSEINANFIVNRGTANSHDVKNLIEKIEAKVLSTRGITLEREIVWWE